MALLTVLTDSTVAFLFAKRQQGLMVVWNYNSVEDDHVNEQDEGPQAQIEVVMTLINSSLSAYL